MVSKIASEKWYLMKVVAELLILITVIISSGCVQDNSEEGLLNQTSKIPLLKETAPPKIMIEKISGELQRLQSGDWAKLVKKLGRPRSTNLLWYHLKKTFDLDIKMIYGDPDKLNTNLAIMEKTGGVSSIQTINIKGVEYYIIDPMTPIIITDFTDFRYGYIFDDPSNNQFFGSFRLNTEDIDMVRQWIQESGVNLIYTDFPSP